MTDIIDQLAGIEQGNYVAELRRHREQARENAQRSFDVLFEPDDPGTLGYRERYAVAAFVAGLSRFEPAERFYADVLGDAAEASVVDAVRALVERGAGRGPFGTYHVPALAEESTPGPVLVVTDAERQALGARLAAAIEHAHLLWLHPRDASPAALRNLAAAGWSADDIVTLSQLIAFLSFQLRVAQGLAVVAGRQPQAAPAGGDAPDGSVAAVAHQAAFVPAAPASSEASAAATVIEYSQIDRPQRFQQGGLDWAPWIEPLREDELTERHYDGLAERSRAKSAYFRLLVRNPEALQARTLVDFDIFGNTTDGLPRADRELAAAAASRANGCLYCASVHSRRASHYSGRTEDVQRLLDEGVGADLGERWNAIVGASVALTAVPSAFGEQHVRALRGIGLDDLDVIDVINGAAFFAWANRLMLSLGEPFLAGGRAIAR